MVNALWWMQYGKCNLTSAMDELNVMIALKWIQCYECYVMNVMKCIEYKVMNAMSWMQCNKWIVMNVV